MKRLNWFLRDWRNDEPTHMDPRLFDVLWEAYRSNDRMGPDDPIIVVSAYRCPATNAMLRRRTRGVALHSQHMLGKAMDTTMPGLSMEKLREIGMRMQRGGVGYYPRANTPFVHLDVGNVRHWPRMSYDQLAELFPDGKTVHIPSNGKLLPGYEEARADILARGGEAATVEQAQQSGGGLRGFFAFLFGGGGEEEEEARAVAPGNRAVAGRNAQAPQPADAGDDEGGDSPRLEPQRHLMAKAETDLPRGETFMGAPPAASAARRPSRPARSPRPQPRSDRRRSSRPGRRRPVPNRLTRNRATSRTRNQARSMTRRSRPGGPRRSNRWPPMRRCRRRGLWGSPRCRRSSPTARCAARRTPTRRFPTPRRTATPPRRRCRRRVLPRRRCAPPPRPRPKKTGRRAPPRRRWRRRARTGPRSRRRSGQLPGAWRGRRRRPRFARRPGATCWPALPSAATPSGSTPRPRRPAPGRFRGRRSDRVRFAAWLTPC